MLRDADTAMYAAKAQGRGRHQLFDVAMHDAAQERLRLESDLARAIEREEFVVHYQPIMSLDDAAHRRASRRWCDGGIPSSGLLAPGRFMQHRRGDRAGRPARPLGAARGLPPAAASGSSACPLRPTSR